MKVLCLVKKERERHKKGKRQYRMIPCISIPAIREFLEAYEDTQPESQSGWQWVNTHSSKPGNVVLIPGTHSRRELISKVLP